MHNGPKDWQIRQHENFSHFNYLHQPLTPRTTREAYGRSVELATSYDFTDIAITAIAYGIVAGLTLLVLFV